MKNTSARGVGLVEQVIAAPADRGERQGLPEAQLEALRFPGGEPLPPSLRRWLAFDARMPLLVDEARGLAFEPLTFAELLDQEFGEGTSESGWDDVVAALPGDCYLLPGGADSRRFLYVGRADARGEFPVLVVDTDELPFVCVSHPGFDVWLADDAGVLGGPRDSYDALYDDPVLGEAMAEQARLNLGGRRALGEGAGGESFVAGVAVVTTRVVRGKNPMTGKAIEHEVREPAAGAVPPVQGPGFAARRSR